MHLFIPLILTNHLPRAWYCAGDATMNKIDKVPVLMELTQSSGGKGTKTITNKHSYKSR